MSTTMVPLKDVNVPVAPANGNSTSNGMPTLKLDGKVVSQYTVASKQKKDAEKLMEELKPIITDAACDLLFLTNEKLTKSGAEVAKSVVASDTTGAQIRMSFTSKYGVIAPDDVPEVQEMLAELGVKDANDYLVTTVQAAFDSGVFLTPQGDFNRRLFNAMKEAVDAVASKFSIPSPLECQKVVTPRSNFHERRWKDFPADAQVDISELIKNTVTLTPLGK